jgi:DNA-binding protein H-NS
MKGRMQMALKSMTIEKLVKMKADIESVLASKISAERSALEDELSKLDRLRGGGKAKRGGARGAVAAKYRNPENSAETWAGRGLRPRWLVAALKGGKKLEDFAISPSATGPGKPSRKKAVRGRPKAKD